MENTEKVFGQLANSQEVLQELRPPAEFDEKPQQKRFGALISSPPGRKQKSEFEQLEAAFNDRDHQRFLCLIEGMDVSDYQPDEITVLIDYCLSLDMVSAAFDLAAKARALSPNNARIESAFNALKPPKFIGTRPPQAVGMGKSQTWFKANASLHKGKWVAVNNGNLLAEADSLKELKNKIDENDMNPGTVIEKVL
jgi:hypothetical protein